MKEPERRQRSYSGAVNEVVLVSLFIVNFEQISLIVLLFQLLLFNKYRTSGKSREKISQMLN